MRRKTFEILEEIAADYLHLAQDADAKVDAMRRTRYRWLINLVRRLRKLGLQDFPIGNRLPSTRKGNSII